MDKGSAVFVLWSVKTLIQGSFSRILARYGQDMTVYTQAWPQGMSVRAFFQPMREKGTEQSVPSPLGQIRQDRFVYLGPADVQLDKTSKIEVGSLLLRVKGTHLVSVGGQPAYRWAVLTCKAREVAE